MLGDFEQTADKQTRTRPGNPPHYHRLHLLQLQKELHRTIETESIDHSRFSFSNSFFNLFFRNFTSSKIDPSSILPTSSKYFPIQSNPLSLASLQQPFKGRREKMIHRSFVYTITSIYISFRNVQVRLFAYSYAAIEEDRSDSTRKKKRGNTRRRRREGWKRVQRPDLMERGDLITWEKGRGGGIARFINVSRSE